METTIQRQGSDYLVTDISGIQIRFMRLHEGRDEVTALVRISLAGYAGHLDGDVFDGKLILTGPVSKQQAAKICAERVTDYPSWSLLIDRACRDVRLSLEEGTPFVNLALGEVLPDAPWLLAPLLRLDEHAVLYGMGGTGKSTIALAIAALAASGESDWGLTLTHEPQTVGYIDFEDGEDSFRRRLGAIAAGLHLPLRPSVWYKRGDASLPSAVDSIARQVAQLGITGLIIDSAALACGLEPETADSANAYFRALRSLPIRWSLTIAHQPKDKEKSGAPFGSVFWLNNPRTIIHAVSHSDPADGPLRLALTLVKTNNGRPGNVLGFSITQDEPERIEIVRTERPVYETQGQKVIRALERADGPMQQASLCSATSIPPASISKVLQRLITDAFVVHGADGYSLLSRTFGFPPAPPPSDIPF